MGVGMLKSATDLFAQLELWEEAVTCLKITDDVDKAQAMAEERIAIRPEPGLLCLLAEMTQEPAHALRAWEISGGKYARAQRTLARMAFNRGDKDACISHFQLSLALNPLFEDAWFTMGCCLLQKEHCNEAAEAFSRVVQLNQVHAVTLFPYSIASSHALLRKATKPGLTLGAYTCGCASGRRRSVRWMRRLS